MNVLKKLFSKPKTRRLVVTSSNGFHLRPVAQFVNVAKQTKAEVTAIFKDKTVNAKSVNTLLSLNLEIGDTFSIKSKDDKALYALETCFTTLMHKDTEIVALKTKSHTYEASALQAQGIASGIAIAPLYPIQYKEHYQDKHIGVHDAIVKSQEALAELYHTQQGDNRNIYLAQKELLTSLSQGIDTLEAFEEKIHQESHALQGGKLAAKRVDYLDILQRVKSHLGYSITLSLPTEASILLANDLLPSDILLLKKSHIKGVILKETTPTSHTAILLKEAGIASMIVKEDLKSINTPIILDADAGVLILTPTIEDLKKAKAQQKQNQQSHNQAYARRHEPAITKAGKPIHILANVADIASAKIAKEEGAQGIGLLRTEFLFKETKPSISEQQKAYEEIFSLFTDITVRTLDVGGDKALPYINLPHEENPFLGIRGVRLFKTHPQLLEEQLLAIFKATKHRTLKIMFPMVATLADFTQAKTFAQEIAKKHSLDISNIQFGIMIEVPSVLFLIQEFNHIVDFYSIGTNDLTQYLFAIERTHPTLKTDALSPVVFSALEKILKESTKPVSICGELASESEAIEKLLALGLETLSMSAKRIAGVKEIVREN